MIVYKKNSPFKKALIILLSVFILIVALLFLFLSPIAKYLIEKHDKQLSGREITLDWAYVNPLTGFISLHGLKLYEATSDSVFLSAKSVHANIDLLKLFSRTVEIKHLTLEEPIGKFIQNKKVFNFDDLIKRFSTKSDTIHSAWQVEIYGETIVNGEFHFIDKIIPINYFIKKVMVHSPGKLNEGDTLAAKFSFLAGIGTGEMNGNITINTKNDDYRFALTARDLDLEIIRQYIWELINYGMFTAHLDANVHASGNFKSKENISLKGRLSIRDFHLGKTSTDDYAAFKNLVLVVNELSPHKRKYLFDTISLSHPYLKYERYDSLDNLQTLFGKRGKNITDITQQPGRFNLVIEIARYIKVITNNFFKSDYKIKSLKIDQGDLQFNDYSISEKFSVNLNPLSIVADSVNENSRVKLFVDAGLKPYGKGNVQLSINPKDSGDFDIHYHFQKIPASVFNPYLLTYTSFPVNRGTLEFNGDWRVREGAIESTNHLVVIDPRISKRIRNNDMRWIPMPLIMAFIREEGNVIDYNIPITGNLKNPKFHLRDAVFDVVKNIFVKPPTTPYRFEVKDNEIEIEKLLTVQWEMRQRKLRPHQADFIKRIAKFFNSDSNATLTASPYTFVEREKEQILFYETKKKYFMLMNHKDLKSFYAEDSLQVEKMSIKDKALVSHISKNLSDTVMFTLQEKCVNFIGNKLVSEEFNQLIKARERAFLSYFKENGTEKQVKILDNLNDVPYNGFSYFKLKYGKDIPPSLQKAYDKMLELNNEEPRKRYKQFRESALSSKK